MNDFIPEVTKVNPEIISLDNILDSTICGECNHTHFDCTCGRFSIESTKSVILKDNKTYSDNHIIYKDQLFILGYDFEDCKFNCYHLYDRWIDALCIINHGEINQAISIENFNKLNEVIKVVYLSALSLNLKYVIQVDLKDFINKEDE